MADEIDLANELIDNEVSRALNEIRKQTAQGGKGSKFCIECEDDMPKERQKLGFMRCVPCAEENERKRSLYAD